MPFQVSIRTSVIWRSFLILLLGLLLFVAGAWSFIIAPMSEKMARSSMELASHQVDARVQRFLNNMEILLDTTYQQMRNGGLTPDDLGQFNRFSSTVMKNHPDLFGILIAGDDGSSIILYRDERGMFKNRLTNPEVWGDLSYLIDWDGEYGTPLKAEAVPSVYDVRNRPWFQEMMAQEDDQKQHWLAPFISFNRNMPILAVAQRWTAPSGKRYVIMQEMRYNLFSELVSNLGISDESFALLTTQENDLVMGVPKGFGIETLSLLERPEELKIPALDVGWSAWRESQRQTKDIVSYKYNGQTWFAYFQPLLQADRPGFWLGIFAPRAAFISMGQQEIWITLLLLATVAAFSVVVMFRMSARFASVLQQLTRESVRLGNLELESPVTVDDSKWREFRLLVGAQERMRKMLLEAGQRLRENNAALENRVRERTEEVEKSRLIAEDSRQRVTEMADSLPCVVFRFEESENGERRFAFLGKQVQELFGVSWEEVMADPSSRWRYVNPEDKKKASCLMESLDAMGSVGTILERVEAPGRPMRWIEARADFMMKNGRPCWNGYWLDVTSRQKALSDLEFQLMFQEVLLDTLPNPVFFRSADGRIAGCNMAYERLFSIRRGDLIGKTDMEAGYLPQKELEAHYEEDKEIIAASRKVTREVDILLNDGRTIRMLYLASGFTFSSGGLGGMVGSLVDISEQDRARALAEEAARAKADFLANMSHEIRTPLNAVIGMAYLALRTDLNPQQQDYVSKIHGAGQHLLGLVNNILDFSKIEAGKVELEQAKFDLEEVLENLFTMVSEKSRAKNLEIVFHVSQDAPTQLIGDAMRLQQMLINYMNNAVKFTERGEIRLEISVLRREEGRAFFRFAVHDTGVGIPSDKISQLFQSFNQADSSTTRKYGGTGLGLAISRKLAELMGGEVGVKSEYGKGATFWFTAWFGFTAEKPHYSLMLSDNIAHHRVLVVDDSDSARDVIKEMLTAMRLNVSDVSSGDEALELIQAAHQENNPFHVILLDWMMPGMDGIETARQIHAMLDKQAPPILMATAYGREELLQLADKNGIHAVLNKPVSASRLFEEISSVLGDVQVRSRQKPVVNTLSGLGAIRGARILLVEDNELNQQVASEILQEAGLLVDLAENGQVALERARTVTGKPYDLIFMDMQMPVMDGVEATRQLRAQGEKCPIVAMTANALTGDREKCLEVGMNDHISKPIDPVLLRKVLLTWISPRPENAEKQEENGGDASGFASESASEFASEFTSISAPVSVPVTAAEDVSLPEGIPGLDVESGLQRLLGKRAFYRNILQRFLNSQRDTVARLRQILGGNLDDLDEEAWKEARLVAHTLKGVAGNISAVLVEERAKALEFLARDQVKDCSDALDALEEAMHPLLASLEDFFNASAAKEDGAEETEAGEADDSALKELSRLIEDNDADAVDFMAKIAPKLRAVLGEEQIAALRAALDAFNFRNAREILRAHVPRPSR